MVLMFIAKVRVETPLHVAITRGNEQIAELLVRKGSDVTATNARGRTCMHVASYLPPGGVLERAILYGGQVNAADELGRTPLHLQCCAVKQHVDGKNSVEAWR